LWFRRTRKLSTVTQLKDNSIVTVDLAARKQVSVFPLNEPNRSVRLLGLAPDPSGKFLYSIGPFGRKAARSL